MTRLVWAMRSSGPTHFTGRESCFAFPPGRALWRLRMFADNPLQHVISLVAIAAIGAWLGPHLGDIAVATINDPAIHGLGAGLYRVVSSLFTG